MSNLKLMMASLHPTQKRGIPYKLLLAWSCKGRQPA